MSASALVTIMCDYPSCGIWWERGQDETASYARKNLRGTGWELNVPGDDPRRDILDIPGSYRNRMDFCPGHDKE